MNTNLDLKNNCTYKSDVDYYLKSNFHKLINYNRNKEWNRNTILFWFEAHVHVKKIIRMKSSFYRERPTHTHNEGERDNNTYKGKLKYTYA